MTHSTPDGSTGSLYRLEIATDAPQLISSVLIDAGYLQGTEILDGDDTDRIVSHVRTPHPPSTEQIRAELDDLLASLESVDWELTAFEPRDDESWKSSWKESFEPTSLSERISVQPPWSELPEPEEGTMLTIHPGMAFGTGHHATTRAASALLDARLEALGGTPSVLDVGCGSGVLSMAAARLGAGPVLGLDIDREILQVARENLERNALTDDVDLSIQPVGELETTWDVVVANIRSRILRDLRDDLMARVAPGGWLLLSGVMVDQGEAFREEGLPTSSDWRLEREIERSNWLGFELQREA